MKRSKGHVPTGCLKLQEMARNNSEDLKEKKKYGLPAILSNNDVPEERKTNKPAQIRPDSSSIFHLYKTLWRQREVFYNKSGPCLSSL